MTRNVNCVRYGSCLTKAALIDARFLPCDGCSRFELIDPEPFDNFCFHIIDDALVDACFDVPRIKSDT